MAKAVLITGSNEGDRAAALAAARDAVATAAGRVEASSPVMGSEPWGEFREGAVGDFLNQVLVIETELSPHELLAVTQHIEKELGRVDKGDWKPARKYSSRPIDIDILFYDDEVVNSERLSIPHPHIAGREFVLRPLAAVMPDFRHPVTGETVCQMLRKLDAASK